MYLLALEFRLIRRVRASKCTREVNPTILCFHIHSAKKCLFIVVLKNANTEIVTVLMRLSH